MSLQLSADKIRGLLPQAWADIDIDLYEEIDSTNMQARRDLQAGLYRPKLIVAGGQTAGRGRRGKSFYSPKEKGIYMTLVLQPTLPLQQGLRITAAVAVAVCEALQSFSQEKLGIKWVNDIYKADKKICGILTEGISDFEQGVLKSVIIGIGINLFSQEFPEDLPVAGTLCAAETISREEVIAAVAKKVLESIADLENPQLMHKYREYSILLGQPIRYEYNGVTRDAVALDIDEDGGLIIQDRAGNRHILNSGEVTVRKDTR